MSDSHAPPKSEQIPCPLSHLLLALVAVAPAVITVPANLNIVLTAAVTVWVGSKRSVKDTPPEESMTRTVRGRSRQQGLVSLECFDKIAVLAISLAFTFHFTHSFALSFWQHEHIANVFLSVFQDALKFPLVGSAVLFGLFITFKILPKNLVNLVLAGYFALLGVLALTATLLPFIERICSARVKKMSYTAPKFNVPSWLSKVCHRCIGSYDTSCEPSA